MKPVAQTFAKLNFSLAESLLKNLLLNSRNKFDINSVHQYYKNIEVKDNFNLNLTTDKVLEVLPFIGISEATGIDKISGRFLEDGANILANPLTKICDISISSGLFPSDFKIAKLKPLY